MADDPIGRLLDAAAGRLAAYGFLLTGSQQAGDRLVEDAIVRVFSRRRAPGAAAERLVKEAMRVASVTRHAAEQHEPGPPDGIGDALAPLTPRERTVTVLRHYDRLTIPQIAATLGIPEASVERALADALARLTATLGPIDPVMDPVPILTRRAS